jgi:putative hemolysin
MIFLAIFLLLLLSAFFSGTEIAFISANKLGIEVLKNKGHRRGELLATFYEKPREFISAMVVGNNIVLVVLTILATSVLETFLYEYFQKDSLIQVLVITGIITVVVLIFGEFLPKMMSRAYSNELLYRMAYTVNFFLILLKPPTWMMTKLSNGVLRILNVSDDKLSNEFSRIDLQVYLDESVTHEKDIDKEILTNVLNLNTLRIRDCYIPRNEIVSIDKSDSVETAVDLIKNHKISRIIVIDDDIENICGYIHHQQLLTNPKKLDKIILPIKFIPESMALPEALKKFILERNNIAIVVDEFGGVSGLITLEDILEEIFGEIEDEHDEEGLFEMVLSENEYLFAGRMEIDYINEKYPDLDIPEGEYQTLSGYIVSIDQNIPEEGEEITTHHLTFIIEKMSDTKIDLVKIRLNQPKETIDIPKIN